MRKIDCTLQSVKKLVKKVDAVMARRKVVDATMRELSKLTDHELKDIGVNRHDIRLVAEGINVV